MLYTLTTRRINRRLNTVHCIRRRRIDLGSTSEVAPNGDTYKPWRVARTDGKWQLRHRVAAPPPEWRQPSGAPSPFGLPPGVFLATPAGGSPGHGRMRDEAGC